MQGFFPVVFSFNYKLLQYHNLLSVFLLWDTVKLSGRMKSFSLYFCYNLHLEYLPKACVLMVFSLEWWYWEVVEPLRSRLRMVTSSLCPWKRLCGGPLPLSPFFSLTMKSGICSAVYSLSWVVWPWNQKEWFQPIMDWSF